MGGCSKVSYVKPHQTAHFNGLEKDDDWWNLKCFISIQKKMVSVSVLAYFTVWERLYKF